MFITQYTHWLPADFDLGLIRKRAAERNPYWDRYPGLIFKVFLVQQPATALTRLSTQLQVTGGGLSISLE